MPTSASGHLSFTTIRVRLITISRIACAASYRLDEVEKIVDLLRQPIYTELVDFIRQHLSLAVLVIRLSGKHIPTEQCVR